MNITILSSQGRCGIYEYSQILADGFRAHGHAVHYLGVPHWDDRALWHAVGQVADDCELLIVEYEPGIFRLRSLVLALLALRRRGLRLMLSIHELELDKFPDSHHLRARLQQPVRFGGVGEVARIAWATAEVAARYSHLRGLLFALGALPQWLLVHSAKGEAEVGLIVNPASPRLLSVPHLIKKQEPQVAALRRSLALPEERFLFIVPGFLFRRKRIVEVIQQLPSAATLLVVGTVSQWDPGYLEEIQGAAARRPEADIRLIEEYEGMEQFLGAADAAVLFYEDGFQSGIAALALGAGKPCIFSDLPAFRPYAEGAMLVNSAAELRRAMQQIQEPERYAALQAGAHRLRERHSPARIAAAYLAPLGRVLPPRIPADTHGG